MAPSAFTTRLPKTTMSNPTKTKAAIPMTSRAIFQAGGLISMRSNVEVPREAAPALPAGPRN